MAKKNSQEAVILRGSRSVRVLCVLFSIIYAMIVLVFAWDLLKDPENILGIAALYCIGLLLMLPAAFYAWHWRMVLDRDGLHRRRFFVWRHRSWAQLTRITQSRDANGNQQLWLYFSEGKPWYLSAGSDGYGKAKLRLRSYRSIELRQE